MNILVKKAQSSLKKNKKCFNKNIRNVLKKKKKNNNKTLIIVGSIIAALIAPIVLGVLALIFEDSVNKFLEDKKVFEPKY